jgi:hypothetical protein
MAFDYEDFEIWVPTLDCAVGILRIDKFDEPQIFGTAGEGFNHRAVASTMRELNQIAGLQLAEWEHVPMHSRIVAPPHEVDKFL